MLFLDIQNYNHYFSILFLSCFKFTYIKLDKMSANINSIYIKEKNYIAVFIKGILNTELALNIISYTKDEMERHNCHYVFF